MRKHSLPWNGTQSVMENFFGQNDPVCIRRVNFIIYKFTPGNWHRVLFAGHRRLEICCDGARQIFPLDIHVRMYRRNRGHYFSSPELVRYPITGQPASIAGNTAPRKSRFTGNKFWRARNHSSRLNFCWSFLNPSFKLLPITTRLYYDDKLLGNYYWTLKIWA